MYLEQFRFLSWMVCVCVSGVKERELALKNGEGREVGDGQGGSLWIFVLLFNFIKKE
jgi:hypothetical protein